MPRQPPPSLPTPDTTPADLAANARALLTLLTGASTLYLERIHVEAFTPDHQLLRISAHREHVAVSPSAAVLSPTDAPSTMHLVGSIIPWNPTSEHFDHRRPFLRFTSLDQLCTWLLKSYGRHN